MGQFASNFCFDGGTTNDTMNVHVGGPLDITLEKVQSIDGIGISSFKKWTLSVSLTKFLNVMSS